VLKTQSLITAAGPGVFSNFMCKTYMLILVRQKKQWRQYKNDNLALTGIMCKKTA